MTIKQRFEAVKNKELREKLLKNYDPDFHYISDGQCATHESSLRYGFSWSGSPEGTLYWMNLHDYIISNQCSLDEAYAKVHGHGGNVPDMPSTTPPPPKTSNVMEDAGFKLPINVTWVKQDPNNKREPEYSYFCARQEGDRYIVTKSTNKQTAWVATFDKKNFIAWAKENT